VLYRAQSCTLSGYSTVGTTTQLHDPRSWSSGRDQNQRTAPEPVSLLFSQRKQPHPHLRVSTLEQYQYYRLT
jgi:hypothetical protein